MSMRSAHDGRIRRHVGLRSLALVAAAATMVSGSALAANIVGTPGNDTIRGTAKADKLYGRQGSDRLYGLAGDDYLNGGAGRDRFSCGAGKDTVVAEAGEPVGRDCEIVRRTGADATPPPATPPLLRRRRRRHSATRSSSRPAGEGRVLRRLREHGWEHQLRRRSRRPELLPVQVRLPGRLPAAREAQRLDDVLRRSHDRGRRHVLGGRDDDLR